MTGHRNDRAVTLSEILILILVFFVNIYISVKI